MRVFAKFFLLLLAMLFGRWLQAQREPTPPTFRTSTGMVLVPVTVTDHNGKTVDGLRQENFTVFDEQVSQQIVSFAREDSPCSVGLVLDISGSMRNTLGGAKEVIQSYFKTANPEDEFLLLTVSTDPAAMPAFSTDIAALEQSIKSTRSGGMTALIDTIYLGLSRMREARQTRRALLILSDGIDNQSQYSERELIRVAIEADVQIYSIIIDNGLAGGLTSTIPFHPGLIRKPAARAQERQGLEMLEKLSDKTGGLHFRVRTAAEAKDAATKAGDAIRNVYVIGYRAPDANPAGKWHRIRVKVDVPHTNVSARSGFR